MAQSQFSKKIAAGFTLIEVAVALTVLVVGLMSVAALFATAIKGTSRTEYMTQAATLASEKLEDLNHFPSSTDPHVFVAAGGTAGSITTDTSANVTVGGVTTPIYYFDEVFFSPTQGSVSETVSGLDANGNVQYSTTVNQPNGIVIPNQLSSSRAALIAGSIYFKRRWVIEQDQPIAGLKRVTVWVSLENLSIAPDVQFQMSIIRP
jgi:prepilin-type N-terminal cleavage/methylation domain-containing protein